MEQITDSPVSQRYIQVLVF